jgi:hypothetical protein
MLNKMVLQQCRTTNWLVLEQIQSISADFFKGLACSPSEFKVLGGGYRFRTPKPINQKYVFDFQFEDLEMMVLWPIYQTKHMEIETRDRINNLSAYCMIQVWTYLSFQDVWWKVLTWPNLLQMTAGQPTSTAEDSKLHIMILPFKTGIT